MASIRYFMNSLENGDFTRMCKQCAPGLFSGPGGGEGPGDEAIAILAFKVPLTEIVLYYVIPMRL